jgi:site-specific recombinase XerD
MTRAASEAQGIARHINEFLQSYIPSQKSHSDHTLKAYRDALTLYIGFLEKAKGIKADKLSGTCFTREMVEEWLGWLSTIRSCSSATCNNRLAALRTFLKYLGSKDISFVYLVEGARDIKRKKEVRKRAEGMSKKAVKALLEAPDQSTAAGRRDLVLMIVLYNTACRIDELLSLKVKQLQLDGGKPSVTVIGKGAKIRTLYLLPKTVTHLKRYLEESHGSSPDPDSYVFFSRNKGPSGKMTQAAVSKQLKKHAAAAHEMCSEVPLSLHAHQWRHAKASHWLEDGMNIVQISFLLGHEHIQTTMVYLDVTTEQEFAALATLEDENDKGLTKKWKAPAKGLAGFCGLKTLK